VLLRRVDAAVSQGSQYIAAQALSIGVNTFSFASSLFITLYLVFFLLRDGDQLSQSAWRALPLASSQKQELRSRFTAVIRATIKGSLMIAVVQGTLGEIAFLYLGIKGSLLWAILMAVASVLPVVGTALIWLPVAAYFFLNGEPWKAMQLVVYGVTVIGLIDNLLRPALVGRDARLPDYVVMITTLGGMAVFGINGFVIGPVIAAMSIAVWHMCTASEAIAQER
jgi:predicted PurR-regulated permease PerM